MYCEHHHGFDTNSSAMIDDAGLCRHSRNTHEVHFKQGQTLFHQGDPADLLYEVTQGIVRQERVSLNGRRQVMSFGYVTDIVGVSHSGIHHSTCKMITPGVAISHSGNAHERISTDPDLHKRVFDAALVEIGGLHDHFEALRLCSAMERVAGFIARLVGRIGVDTLGQTVVCLPMCRSEIADYLVLSTETISRMISQLRASQVISLANPQTAIVHDIDKLRVLAEGE